MSQTDILQSLIALLSESNLDSNTSVILDNLLKESALHHSDTWAAHMTPDVSLASILGKALAAHHNGNLLSSDLYPTLQSIEQETLSWLSQKLNFPHCYFTAGSSYGNLEALWRARDQQPSRKHVYGSSACHYSIIKACDILGLEFIAIESDELGRIYPESLKAACQQHPPVAIILNAGNTSCGETDPLETGIALSKQFQAWCHIDAAWGGSLVFLEEHNEFAMNLSQADSLCFDPHKALGQPKPCGLVCYQTPRATLNTDAHYLTSPPQKSISGSTGGELFLSLWLDLKLRGENCLINNIRIRLREAQQFADGLDKELFWSHHSKTGIVSFIPTKKSDISLWNKARIFSTTQLNGKEVFRAVFASTATSAESLLKLVKNHL